MENSIPPAEMFFEGDLESGIALAVNNSKAVICFVRDDSDTSRRWEHDLLTREKVRRTIESDAVTLKLEAGSREAGYLAPFCALDGVPFVLVIRNGGVREFIKADVGPADFETRLLTSLLHSTRPTNSVSSSLDQSRGFGDASAPTGDETLLASDAEAPSPSSDANEERPQADTLKQMLSARDKGKGKAVDSEEEARIATKVAAAHAQLTRIRGEKAERERILKHVKQDQIDRRKREQDGREAKQQTANASGSTSSIIASSGWKNRSAEEVRVSVRIFDGTSLRRKFSTSQSIQADVRPWIDASRPDGSAPYTLKQILTPQPSRAIEFSEETETLGNLINVGTTANLVMVPVKAYTDAYTSSAPVLAMRGASTAYGLFSGAIGKAMRTFGAGLGYPQEPTSSDNTDGPSSAASDSKGSTIAANQGTSRPGGMNIRTPADHQQYEDDRQFYNGNQTNFEPWSDDEKHR